MTECYSETDVKELAQSTLAEFEQEVAGLSQELCAPFNAAAKALEGQLLTIYKVVVQNVRREEDLEKIAKWWGTMMAQCDEFAKRLHDLACSHPDCGAEFFYDRVLDLRNKCQRLRQMHS